MNSTHTLFLPLIHTQLLFSVPILTLKITYPITVRIFEGPRVDLIEDCRLPPLQLRGEDISHWLRQQHHGHGGDDAGGHAQEHQGQAQPVATHSLHEAGFQWLITLPHRRQYRGRTPVDDLTKAGKCLSKYVKDADTNVARLAVYSDRTPDLQPELRQWPGMYMCVCATNLSRPFANTGIRR